MKFKIKKEMVKPGIFKKVIEESLDTKPYSSKKYKLRYKINTEVFDLHDSVADNAKMISLLFALLSRIYDALPDTVKAKIPDKDREIIEYAFNRYHSIQTRADVEFAINGIDLVNRLMERQSKIGDLFKQIYEIK